jgi:ABC-type glycerol-3-phosphate transport system permease component
MHHTENRRFRPSHIWTYLALIVLAIIVLLPLEWIIASSFTNRETVFKNVLPFSLQALYPENPTLQAYRAIFNDGFGRAIVNTLGVAITTSGSRGCSGHSSCSA